NNQEPRIKNVFLMTILLVFATSSCVGVYEDAAEMATGYKTDVQTITVDTLKAKVEKTGDFLLIDVRQPSDYYTANIPGSVSIPRGILEFKIAEADFWMAQYMYPPEKNTEIIVYCNAGNNSILAAAALKNLGYKNVKSLTGGYKAYNPNQDPNVKPKTSGGCGG
ncbi:rhodanese-like domain-containing protein, partial [bacterium]|nr:rhodanese-like domain-containing protein [bacterium]